MDNSERSGDGYNVMGLPKTLMTLSKVCLAAAAIGFVGEGVNLYLSGGPAIQSFAEIAQKPFFQSGFWVILLIGGVLGAGIFAMAGSFAGKRLYRQIIHNGLDAEARLIKVTDTGTRINECPLLNISMEVHPPGAPSFFHETRMTFSIVDLPKIQPGKTVRVKYIPGTDKVAIVGATSS